MDNDCKNKKTINVISMSGGKDSTATLLLALERKAENIMCIFADTGHEHKETYDYLDYLRVRLNIKIHTVKADFSKQILKKRQNLIEFYISMADCGVRRNKRIGGWSEPSLVRAIDSLKPTGNPFLDLCLWKGRFPSTRARFCSEELKHHPLDMLMLEKSKDANIVSWQGVRADESLARKDLPEKEEGDFYSIYRPIIAWTAVDVFAMHKKHNVKPNPLYLQGMSRVGCMPCIHSRKSELRSIGARFPAEIERVAGWERAVTAVSKRGCSTLFHASTDPTIKTKNNSEITLETHGIDRIVDWANTSRGGRQRSLIDTITLDDVTMCSSAYGLCE